MPSGIKIPKETEYRIISHLLIQPHASFVARAEGVSFSKVWRLAERECIELTAGRAAKGYKRLSPERRAKVIEVRRANPNATQEEIALIAGVSRSTVWRIERGRRGALVPPLETFPKVIQQLDKERMEAEERKALRKLFVRPAQAAGAEAMTDDAYSYD